MMILPIQWEGLTAIYCIRNTANGKEYVGGSRNIRNRLYKHRSLLRNNKHDNKRMQASWDKYGENYFIAYVLEECDIENLLEREQYYMDKLHPVYNTLSALNIVQTEAMKQQHSATKKKMFAEGLLATNCAKVTSAYDFNGNLIKTSGSKQKLAKELGIPFTIIHKLSQTPYYVTESYRYVVLFGDQPFIEPLWSKVPYYMVHHQSGIYKVAHLFHLTKFYGFPKTSIQYMKSIVNTVSRYKNVNTKVFLINQTT